MNASALSADTSEALMGIAAALSFLLIFGTALWNRRVLWLLPGAAFGGFIVGRIWGWNEFVFIGLLAADSVVVGNLAFILYNRLTTTRRWPLLLAYGAMALTPILLTIFDRAGLNGFLIRERGAWAVYIYLVGPVAIWAVWLLSRVAPRVMAWASQLAPAPAAETAATSPAPVADPTAPASGDQHQVMQLLHEGKISPSEAADLLAVLEPPTPPPLPPADSLPLGRPERLSIIGALIVTVGFALPWGFIHIDMPMLGVKSSGFQAGYLFGALGWVVLLVGVLPALLSIFPVLDGWLRLGVFRLVFSAIGAALTAGLCLTRPANLGIWVCLAGFVLQLVTALGQSGLLAQSEGRGAASS